MYSYRNVWRVGACWLLSRCAFPEAAALYGTAAPASADRLPPPSEEQKRPRENTGCSAPPPTMAAEIHSRPQTARPVLLNKIEGHSDSVTGAVLIPKEDGVITVSEDR